MAARDLEGKVFLVTGATEGIGKAAALEFAKRGATLALVARNREKGARVAEDIKAGSGNERVETLVGDLSTLADIRAVADAFRAKHNRLDVLVNNAGAVFEDYRLSADGIEMTFALNHVGYFLLTARLADLLQQTPAARVVSTSSGAHQMGTLDLDTVVKRGKPAAGFRAYGDSKLANVLFTRELARRLAPTGGIANCFHPGFVQSGFALNNGGLTNWVVKYSARLFARTPARGADTLVWLATSPDAACFSGEYFHDRKVAKTSKRAKDDALARRLWALSEQLCGATWPAPADGAAREHVAAPAGR